MNVFKWAESAQPGQRVVYASRTDAGNAHIVDKTAMGSAMLAHRAGLVFLAQRRRGDLFDYEATRISPMTAKKLGLLWDEGKPLGCGSVGESLVKERAGRRPALV